MILVEHAVVITMDPARRIFMDGSVLMDGERIVAVGRATEVVPPRPPERVIDGRGRLVLPGFVDTHVHLSEHLARGLIPDEVPVDRYVPDWYAPLYAAITPEEEAAAAQLACLEMLRTGTTTFCEAGTLFDVPAVAQAVEAEWRPLLDPVSTLVYSASAASVRAVLVDGRILLDDRRVTTVNEGEILARAERLSRVCLARATLAPRSKWPLIV